MNCSGTPVPALFQLPAGHQRRLYGQALIRRIPYIKVHFGQRLNQFGYAVVDDIVRTFSTVPPMTPNQINNMLARMVPNPNQYRCVVGRNTDNYHVADVNVCAYNSILELLIWVHNNRHNWQLLEFTVVPNIPNAHQLNLKNRGTLDARGHGARFCLCRENEAACNGAVDRNTNVPVCRWTPPHETNIHRNGQPVGVCTPLHANPDAIDGFSRAQHTDPDQWSDDVVEFDNNGVPSVQHPPMRPDLNYVRQWRVHGGAGLQGPPGPPPPPPPGQVVRVDGWDQQNHRRLSCTCVPGDGQVDQNPPRHQDSSSDSDSSSSDSDSSSSSDSDSSSSSDDENNDNFDDDDNFDDAGVLNDNNIANDNHVPNNRVRNTVLRDLGPIVARRTRRRVGDEEELLRSMLTYYKEYIQ